MCRSIRIVCPLLTCLVLAAPAVPAPRADPAAADTSWFGGTLWAPDSNRWEAIPGGTWTFDSGVGSNFTEPLGPEKTPGYHHRMEGWAGISDTYTTSAHEYRRTGVCSISGSFSMWVGRTQPEADSLCWAAGQGYGNSWDAAIGQTFNYPGSGSVTLSYRYAVDSEPGFDYLKVMVDTTGAGSYANAIELASYSGVTSGTAGITLAPGAELPAVAGPVAILFLATSDGSYSDEDGLSATTCGHSAIDNVALSGAITHSADFEAGDDGWTAVYPYSPYSSDFADIRHLSSIPPGTLEGTCGLADSVLTFMNPEGHHGGEGQFLAVSPWIDLKASGDFGRPGKHLAYHVYTDFPAFKPLYTLIQIQYYPYVCPGSGMVTTSPMIDAGIYPESPSPYCTPGGSPKLRDISSLIAEGAEQVRVALGIEGICSFAECAPLTPTPYFDNVRFGVTGGSVSAVPENRHGSVVLHDAAPNPMRAMSTIRYEIPVAGPVTLRVFDVTGQAIRTLADETKPVGLHEVHWNGRDEIGREVASGLYFYQLTARGFSESRKLIVVHPASP